VEKDFHLEISTGQGEERTEVITSGFQHIGATTIWSHHTEVFHTVFVHVYVGFSGDMHAYTWVFLRKDIHLEKRESLDRTTDQELLGFVGVV
jgi:hypothetical protein